MHTGTLRMFCAVAENHSFTRAAHQHGCTTAHASQSVSDLENEFAVQLALRDSVLFQLTTAGDIVHEGCRELLAQEQALVRDMDRARAISARTITLAACFSYGLHHFQPRLRQFQAAHPALDIHVRYEHIDTVHELVLDLAVDVGLVAYPRRRPGLAVEPLGGEPLVLVCHPRHRLATSPAVPVAALRNLPIIAWREIPWAAFLRQVPDSQRHLFEPRHVFHELEMVKQAVEREVGVAVLPAATVQTEVADRRLAAVPFADGRHTEPLGLIYRKDHRLTPPLKKFIEFLKPPGAKAG
jgi:DNA-binding transcriptional LysR family regulator